MIFPKRRYKSGTRWCVWRWTLTPSGYITRLHLLQTPFGSIMLHWINAPDPEPWLHDHPVTFLSLILRGGYTEAVGEAILTNPWRQIGRLHVCRWFNFIRATTAHRILTVKPGTLTLCFMTPKKRDWGFHTPEGWVYWKTFNEKYRLTVKGETTKTDALQAS